MTVRAQRADLAVSGSVNLADAALEGRLTLFGMGGTNAPANTRPEITIGLKGPVDTPKRSIDVAALSSWLALRAVEQQSKKLEALEGRRAGRPIARDCSHGKRQSAHGAGAACARDRRRCAGSAAHRAGCGRCAARGATPAGDAESAEAETRRAHGRTGAHAAAADRRPSGADAARTARRRSRSARRGTQPQPQKPVAAPAPPRQRSLSEILFGN